VFEAVVEEGGVGAVEGVVDVATLGGEVGSLVVVELVVVELVVVELVVVGLVTVADMVGPAVRVLGTAVRVCGEGPQAATSSSTPTANAVTLAPRTDVRTINYLLPLHPSRPDQLSSNGSRPAAD